MKIDRPWSEMSESDRQAVLDWVVQTCLLFGSSFHTAYLVAGTFAKGLDSWAGTLPRPDREPVHKNDYPR